MITPEGYSKDPTIQPEGIVITFGQTMLKEQGGMRHFMKNFLQTMADHEAGNYWMHTLSNFPTHQQDRVYIIIANRLWGRVLCGGYHRNHEKNVTAYGATGEQKLMDKPFIILSGPFEKCPTRRTLRGFQGARYCTKLF